MPAGYDSVKAFMMVFHW